MNLSSCRGIVRCGLTFLAALIFALSGQAQQTLGSINGTVVDPSGAAVPAATITVTNSATNLTETTTTQRTGFFQIFNLPIGSYIVKIAHEGFDTSELTGIAVQEARTATINASLKIGKASESVEVTANPMLNASDATNGYTLDAAQIDATPLATGSFTQLATLSPGVNAELLSGLNSNAGLGNQPIWANGQRDTSNTFQVNGVDATNLFNGKSSSGMTSQRYNFNIGGGSTSSASSAGAGAIGGASPTGTSVYGSVGNSLPSPPPDFVAEIRVNTSMYDAQQGATSGAQIDVSTKTGSNIWHGMAWGTFANNSMNASPFFFNQQYQLSAQDGVGSFPKSLVNPYLQRWTAGGEAGGPLVKNKLFVFFAYQRLDSTDQSTGLSQMTVPSGLTDDRSTAGLDAAATSWNTKGTPFTSAIDPVAAALMNAKLPNGQYLIPSAQSTAAYQYGVPNVTLIGNSVMTGNQAAVSADYVVNEKDRLSVKYYYQSDPVSLPYNFSQTGGFPVTQNNGSQVAAIDNTIVVGSHLNWEQRLGFARQGSYSYYTQTLTNPNGAANFGVGSQDSTGLMAPNPGLPGLLLKSFASSQNDSPGLKVGPYSSFANIGFYQNRINPSTNLIWAKGKHTLVVGGGYNYTQLNIENNRDGIAQIQSKTFQKFLTGAVSSSNVLDTIVNGHNNADRYYRTNELAGYVQDKWQALTNLSITAGVRYDYHGGMTEKFGNMFNFDPALYSVTGTTTSGFTVNNAGFVVAGNNKSHPTTGVSDSTLDGRQWGISPRIGFAWSPKYSNDKIVVSGGGGIYYDRGELFQYLSQPAGSGNGGPFGVTESAPLAGYVVGNGKTLENPLGSPTYTPPTSDPGTITSSLQNVLNGMTGKSKYYGPNCGGVDNQEGYTDCPDTLNFGAYDKSNVLPYTINYTFNVQWQPRNDIAILVGYTGNRGRHSVVPIPFNEPGIATPSNPIWGETASYGFEVLNQNSMSDGYDYDPIAGEPWNTEDGGNTDFRTPYIGFSPNAALFKTVGNSAYDALQTHVEKRLSYHFQAGASYTWSHALDEQSDIGLFFTGNNPNNLRSSWASSDFDRTHVVSGNFQVEIPNTASKLSTASYFLNDWHLTGTGVVQSGEPYSLYEFYGAVGSINFGDYPTLMNPVLGIKNPSNRKSALTGNSGAFRGTAGAYIPTIDPTQISINYLSPGQMGIPTSTGSDPQDIYETAFAPSGQRNLFRQAMQKRLDLSIRKTFHATNRIDLQYEFNIFNITNTTSLDVPMDQAQIRQNSACSNSAIKSGNNCETGNYYYVNYGQIVTSNSPGDQQSALANLDELPYSTGSGKALNVPLTIPLNATGGCITGGSNVL
ncbi:MAG TPA: carboxypeptidase regulatory-like domain-containing protein, partial [Terracidiphilus sp.]